MRKKNKLIIWPTYFDLKKTRKEGRRIPKSLAVSSPKILEVKHALEKLGFNYEVILDAGYPKTPWLKTGLIIVTKTGPKHQIIKKIAKQLLTIRDTSPKK